MRHSILILSLALFMVAGSTPVFAATETVTGQLIDMACYIMNKANTGNAHKGKGYNCAQACAREGFSVGLLTAEGKVYQVTGGLAANKNALLVPHISETVIVTGEVSEKDGQSFINSNELKPVPKQ